MPDAIPRRRRTLIDRIVVAARGLRNAPTAELLREYFRGVGEEDLALHEPREFALLARAHHTLAQRKGAGQSCVEVLSPEPGTLGVGEDSSLIFIATDDRPFLVESVGIALAELGVSVRLLIHPVLSVHRDGRGRLTTRQSGPRGPRSESWQAYEIERQRDPQRLRDIESRIRSALEDVAVVVDDWIAMRARVQAATAALRAQSASGRSRLERDEATALLDWVESGHFVMLGYRYQRLLAGRRVDRLAGVARSGLGLLRSGRDSAPRSEILQGRLREALRSPSPLIVTKSTRRSTVHRAGYLDHLAIKAFDARGRVIGEHRLLGLWTATAYFASPAEIPVVRRKVAEVVERFGLDPRSHDGKAVLAVLETWPRDELLQSSVGELVDFIRGVVNLYERRTTRLMMRHDALGRFWSCMVFVPRDLYTTETRLKIERLLQEACDGTDLESQVQIALSNHARLHVTVRGGDRALSSEQTQTLEIRIAAAVASWRDRLRETLFAHHPADRAAALIETHADRFPATYQSEITPSLALHDIEALEALSLSPHRPQLHLHRDGVVGAKIHLRVVQAGSAWAIADVLPLLDHFGLRMLAEQAWTLGATAALPAATVQDFLLEAQSGVTLDRIGDGERLLRGFSAVREGRLASDGFNRLVIRTKLEADDINILRAICRYLLQTGIPFSQAYMERTLTGHAELAATLFELFELRHAPRHATSASANTESRLLRRIERELDAVASADEDRILRAFLAVILATLRTNHYQRNLDGSRRGTLALKLDPQSIPGLPLPRPRREIYVYGPSVEGVHLRMGEVARGGIRWSDRREDFRTEVLGLMKAQNVKNTLIVPVGAKGGFVPRQLPVGGSRDAIQAEGIAAYRAYVNALLDLTDNLDGTRVLAAPGLRRRDGDDPYLVVAADKGTATFSDIANAVAIERDFWLGDAFASGGSAGYDHKKMGITARGAWECVKRHFRELGVDIQRTPFTVAGIGDMSGDVFGNGMLLSRQIKLVAAFNHQHIFLDPDPNPATSFAERARLFALPRSGWLDYDRKRLSRGGAIFERSAKSLTLSPEIRRLLDIDATHLAPNELIRAILRMRVDLLWNGGIGTYVKASSEPQTAAGDRGNDAVRIDGRELRARVVGEGGNLGFTQPGRIEYALTGGRLNTDFIDNSAGVNTSDVEVNLKILTSGLESRGRLQRRARDRLLASLTDEVASLVLRNNYLQSQALSTLERQGAARLPELHSTIRSLERAGELDRTVESLPDDETLQQRRQQGLGLTRPELAVVLAYAKISLNRQLIASDLPEDPYFAAELARYFPAIMRDRYERDIRRHRLQREIVTTAVTNSLVNRMGPSFVGRMREESGASAADVARAYSIARETFAVRELWSAIESQDNRVPAAIQYQAHADIARLLRHATQWLLRERRSALEVETTVRELATPIQRIRAALPRLLSGETLSRHRTVMTHYREAGMPDRLAAELALLDALDAALDIAVLGTGRRDIVTAAKAWFEVGQRLGLERLEARISALAVDTPLQAVARGGLREAIRRQQREIASQWLGTSKPAAAWVNWSRRRQTALSDWNRTLAEVDAQPGADFPSLTVCVDSLRALAR
ncbi:MAG: NAD-glutamate dehydrogenase [Steroidobacteraceae bacterium]